MLVAVAKLNTVLYCLYLSGKPAFGIDGLVDCGVLVSGCVLQQQQQQQQQQLPLSFSVPALH
jgi:hypothetical protein